MSRIPPADWLRPSAREIRLVSLLLIAAALLLQIASIFQAGRGRPLLSHEPGSDFACFYLAGRILNQHSPGRLYDLDLQARLLYDLFPYADRRLSLPYAYPPFIAAAFRPLALLPYPGAYAIWLVLSAGLYTLGLLLICPRSLSPQQRWTALLAAASFCPFLFETWGGGQLSVIGFAALAAALRLEQSGRPYAAGLAAGLCFYKPTLLVVLLPLLALARRWRMLAGILSSGLALAALSLAAVGRDALSTYPRIATLYGRLLSEMPEVFREHKFVDLNTFLRLLPGGASLPGRIVFFLLAAAALAWAARLWLRYPRYGPEARAACWAGTLPLLLVVSVYAPIYDVTLLVLSGFLLAPIVYAEGREPLIVPFELLALALYLATIVSQPLARLSHVQIVTPVLVACAAFAFSLPKWDTLQH